MVLTILVTFVTNSSQYFPVSNYTLLHSAKHSVHEVPQAPKASFASGVNVWSRLQTATPSASTGASTPASDPLDTTKRLCVAFALGSRVKSVGLCVALALGSRFLFYVPVYNV